MLNLIYFYVKNLMLSKVWKQRCRRQIFQVSGSHCCPKGIKTDATLDFLWDVIRYQVKITIFGEVVLSKFLRRANFFFFFLKITFLLSGPIRQREKGEAPRNFAWIYDSGKRNQVELILLNTFENDFFRHKVSFTMHPGATVQEKIEHMVRYQCNKVGFFLLKFSLFFIIWRSQLWFLVLFETSNILWYVPMIKAYRSNSFHLT